MDRHLLPVLDGKYRLLRKLGTGSMGAVYLAENMAIGRLTAIKVMNQAFDDEPELRRRFVREAQAAAKIRSPHVVEILDMIECAGLQCIIMEFFEGESLADRLKRTGPMSLREVSLWGLQLLEGVRAAHEAGIVHRDLKPENLFLANDGKGEILKILDFGISKVCQRRATGTLTGTVAGTPDYMSPEQARGMEVDARTDLYSAAVILYECASGKTPFHGDNVNDLLFKVALGEPTPLQTWVPNVDHELRSIIARGMARDASARFACALDFQNALVAWREHALGLEAVGDSIRFTLSRPPDHAAARSSLAAMARSAENPILQTPAPRSGLGRYAAGFGITVTSALLMASLSFGNATRAARAKTTRDIVLKSCGDDMRQDLLRTLSPPSSPLPGASAASARAAPAQNVAQARPVAAQSAAPVPQGYRGDPYDAIPY